MYYTYYFNSYPNYLFNYNLVSKLFNYTFYDYKKKYISINYNNEFSKKIFKSNQLTKQQSKIW